MSPAQGPGISWVLELVKPALRASFPPGLCTGPSIHRVHSNDDFDISVADSQTLYEAPLEPHLPPIPYDEQDVCSRRVPFAEMMGAIKRVNAERACSQPWKCWESFELHKAAVTRRSVGDLL